MKIWLVLLLSTITNIAIAAELHVPMEFTFVAVDGQAATQGAFFHKSSISNLKQGTHKIAIRYKDIVPDEFSDTDVKVSSPALIVTIDMDANKKYYLQPSSPIKNAREYAKDPKVLIKTGDNSKVSYSIVNSNIEEVTLASRVMGQQSNESKVVEMTAPTATIPANQVMPNAKNGAVASAPNGATPEQMLQYWWEHADVKTRKQFLNWAITQM